MRTISALSLILATAACAPSAGSFPELGVRPIEGRSDAIEVRPASTATADPIVAARAVAISSESSEAAKTFDAALIDAQAKAKSAGAEGSEGWIAAQLALTRLDQARARTVGGLAEIDGLLLTEYAANRPVAPETATVATELQARADAQAMAIDAVKATLAR